MSTLDINLEDSFIVIPPESSDDLRFIDDSSDNKSELLVVSDPNYSSGCP